MRELAPIAVPNSRGIVVILDPEQLAGLGFAGLSMSSPDRLISDLPLDVGRACGFRRVPEGATVDFDQPRPGYVRVRLEGVR